MELDGLNVESKVDRYVILYSLADSMFNKNRYKESNKYINRALKIYPRNVDSLDLKSKTDKKLGIK